jgi:hypothetical protein
VVMGLLDLVPLESRLLPPPRVQHRKRAYGNLLALVMGVMFHMGASVMRNAADATRVDGIDNRQASV